jgi:hypothetical protein
MAQIFLLLLCPAGKQLSNASAYHNNVGLVTGGLTAALTGNNTGSL